MTSWPWLRGEAAGCPPHGPHLIDVVGEGLYEARCLNCGLVGPERKDSLEAKLAFDQRWH